MNDIIFPDFGTYVKNPAQFVGRKAQLERLVSAITKNWNIVGLPRMGKSSLAYQAILKAKKEWENTQTIPFVDVWFDVSKAHTPKEFFNLLIRAIQDTITVYGFQDLQAYFEAAIKGKLDALNVENYFKYLDRHNIQVVICLDEFDKVREFLKQHHFGCLHSILSASRHIHFIITSRRFIESIEKEVCQSANPSTLHQLFSPITLKPFDQDEMEEYWNRLEPYLRKKNINFDAKYKDMAYWFSGHVPAFLDQFNDFYLFKGSNTDDFIAMMNGIFNDMVKVLKEQELLNPAIQVVCGPVYDCRHDQIEELKRYGFIRSVSSAEKEDMLGNAQCCEDKYYICFSDYFTRRLGSVYKTRAPFWPEWEKTLTLIKKVVNDYIIQNAGEDWELNNAGPFQAAMEDGRKKDKSEGIPVSASLVDYLIDRNLLSVISLAWHVFEDVFDMDQAEFEEKLNRILYVRNHHAHGNMQSINEHKHFLEKITGLCVEVSGRIEKWYKEGDGNLKDPKFTSPSGGIVEKDEHSIYHVGPYFLSKPYIDKKGLMGRHIQVLSCKFNNSMNNGYLYYADRT